jgi:putative ABC transport system permease protein
MLLVARKNLASEPTRLLISVGGVALSVLLIAFLLSLYRGWNEKVGGFVDQVNAEVWIAREGTTDFIAAASILPMEGAEERIGRIETIEEWSPLIVRPMSATSEDGDKIEVHFVGFDPVTAMAAPTIVEGRELAAPGEMIVDKGLGRHGVDVGDKVNAGGREWEVVGKSTGGDFVAAQTVFVTLADAQETFQMDGYATFFILKMKDPDLAAAWAESIQKSQPGILAITSDDFADATRERLLGNLIPILSVILILAFIVGLAVAGLTVYTATVEKTREYGILKAVGFTNGYLYRVVFEQSVVTGSLGFIIGVGLTLVGGPFAQDIVPQFVVLTRWLDLVGVAGATLLMTVLAAYIPVRRIAAIDPVAVFNA